MERVGLKYQIWLKATKETLASERHAWRATFLTNWSKDELKVPKNFTALKKLNCPNFFKLQI